MNWRVLAGISALGIVLFFIARKSVNGKTLPGTMTIGPKGLSLIKRFEGFESTKYLDIAGHETIGYGHKIVPPELYDRPISESEATELLKRDVASAESAVRNLISVPLTQNQFDALVSFVYNLGSENLKSSTLRRLLNGAYYNAAAEQFLVWNKARVAGVLQEVAGLTRRRREERALFIA